MWEVAHLEPRMNVFCGINTHWLEQGRFLADVSELYDGSRWRDIGHVQLVSGTMVYSERVPRGQPA